MRRMPEPPTETIVWGSWAHLKAEYINEKYYGGYIFGSRTAYKRALLLGVLTLPFIFLSPLAMKVIHRLTPNLPGLLKWITYFAVGLAAMNHVINLSSEEMELNFLTVTPASLFVLVLSCYLPWRKVQPRAPRDIDLAEVQLHNKNTLN